MVMKEKSRNEVRDKEVEESKRCERQAGMNPGGGVGIRQDRFTSYEMQRLVSI